MLDIYKHAFFYIYTNMTSNKKKFINKKFKYELFIKCYDEVKISEYWNKRNNVSKLNKKNNDKEILVCNLYSVYDNI